MLELWRSGRGGQAAGDGTGADHSYEPWLCLRTFKDKASTPSLDLELDWWDLFRDRERLPSEEEWREVLFPALQDVKNVLGEASVSRQVHVSVQAILPAAFALGFAFPASSSFTLLLLSNQGTWSTRETIASSSPLRRLSHNGDGDKHVAVIEIAITSSTVQAVANYLSASGLSYKQHIRYDLPGGPNHIDGVADSVQALTMAQQIGKDLRVLLGQGVSHIHLFAAIPAALAVMIGHHFNALCPIFLYEYAHGSYQPACVLG